MTRHQVAIAISLLAAVALATGLTGCGKSSEKGGGAGADTFKIKAPGTATKIKQGDKKTVALTLDRGKDFKQDVTLKAETASKGITPTLEKPAVKSSDATDINLSVAVADDAPVGDHKVTVTGTPDKGAATSVEVAVTVEKK